MPQRPEDIVVRFTTLLGETVLDLLGAKDLIAFAPELKPRRNISRLWLGRIINTLIISDTEQVKARVAALISALESALGASVTEDWLEEIYSRLERAFSPSLANEVILPLVAEQYLEKYRLRLLSREDLAEMLDRERVRDRELAKANEQLRELDRRKSEFISVVAHQLRTPLSGFKWALNMLVAEEVGPLSVAQKDILTKSYAENEHMIALVEEMLRADLIEAGRIELAPEPIDLAALLASIVSEFTELAASKKIILSFTPSDDLLPKSMLDAEKMRAVFSNLVDNAIKYSPVGAPVNITLSREGEFAKVTVTDKGIGIPADQQAEIFTRFFRAQNARKQDPNGNGLGLYIVKNIVSLSGGTVHFESGEGAGTTFTISLPLQPVVH